MLRNKIIWPVLLVSVSLLTGCYQNPMTHTKASKAALALLRATRAAEQQLGFERTTGWGYSVCMEDGFKKTHVDCEALFKAMLPFLKKDSHFNHVTLSQLKDKDAFERIAEDYDMKVSIHAD